MDYWKQFRLSKLAKARVIEICHASKLWFAVNYYELPNITQREIHKMFLDYINFPLNSVTINQDEMHKLRSDGGAKLIDPKIKMETYRIKWLMELTTNENLHYYHLNTALYSLKLKK